MKYNNKPPSLHQLYDSHFSIVAPPCACFRDNPAVATIPLPVALRGFGEQRPNNVLVVDETKRLHPSTTESASLRGLVPHREERSLRPDRPSTQPVVGRGACRPLPGQSSCQRICVWLSHVSGQQNGALSQRLSRTAVVKCDARLCAHLCCHNLPMAQHFRDKTSHQSLSLVSWPVQLGDTLCMPHRKPLAAVVGCDQETAAWRSWA